MWRFASLAVLLPLTAHAGPRLELGGYAGYTSAKTLETFDCPPPSGPTDVCITSSEPHDRESGVSVGAYVRLPIHRAALLELDLAYSQKGINGGTHTTYHYLEMPLLAQVDPLRASSHARVFALAGVAPAVRLACTVDGPIFDNEAHMAVHYSGSCASLPVPLNESAPKPFDLGLVLGAGFGWQLASGTVEVQGRYTHGLIDIDDGGGKTINRALYVLLGYSATLRR